MKSDFDKQIKKLLEDSTATDAGFDLNRTAVWDKIESKQKSKVISFPKWMSHAAAVIIGILLCLPFLFNAGKETVKTVTVVKTIPSVQTIMDTVWVVKTPGQSITKQPRTLTTAKSSFSETIAGQPLQTKQKDGTITNVVPANTPETLIAETKISTPKSKVLHLLDIENENAIPQAKHTSHYALFNKTNIPSGMDDKSQTISMIVDAKFFSSKN